MLAQLGCLPGTCTNQRSPYCLFLWVGNKSHTCHILPAVPRALRKRHLSVRANEADSPEHQPPSVWHVLRVSFPIQRNLTTKKAISQMWGVGFSENRSAFVNGKSPLPMTQINSKKIYIYIHSTWASRRELTKSKELTWREGKGGRILLDN